jgi:hypothetical protein
MVVLCSRSEWNLLRGITVVKWWQCNENGLSLNKMPWSVPTKRHGKDELNIWNIKIRDSSVGIALSCGLDDRGSRVRFPGGGRGAGKISLHHRVQNGSGAHPASYPMGTRGSFPGVKRPVREADLSPPSSAEVKEWVELYLHSPIRLHDVVLS